MYQSNQKASRARLIKNTQKLTPIGELTLVSKLDNWTCQHHFHQHRHVHHNHHHNVHKARQRRQIVVFDAFTQRARQLQRWAGCAGGATNIKTSIILLCNSLIWKLASKVCACRAVLAPFLHERQFWKSKSNVKLSSLQYGLIHSNLDLIQFQKPFLIKHDSKTRLSKHPLHIFCGRHGH